MGFLFLLFRLCSTEILLEYSFISFDDSWFSGSSSGCWSWFNCGNGNWSFGNHHWCRSNSLYLNWSSWCRFYWSLLVFSYLWFRFSFLFCLCDTKILLEYSLISFNDFLRCLLWLLFIFYFVFLHLFWFFLAWCRLNFIIFRFILRFLLNQIFFCFIIFFDFYFLLTFLIFNRLFLHFNWSSWSWLWLSKFLWIHSL